jgi:hypothetical protein
MMSFGEHFKNTIATSFRDVLCEPKTRKYKKVRSSINNGCELNLV